MVTFAGTEHRAKVTFAEKTEPTVGASHPEQIGSTKNMNGKQSGV
jgi:hypothetical protein